MDETIVWISGATEGLGLGLARTVPYPGARIINLSRRQHPDYESVRIDLTEPATWAAVSDHFARELASFKGKRAIFIHNAYMAGTQGYVGEMDPALYHKAITANVVAPLVLGDAFVRACKPDYESGLVLITSAAARVPWEGDSIYCAAKAAAEHWVRVVRRERNRRGWGRGWWRCGQASSIRRRYVRQSPIRMRIDGRWGRSSSVTTRRARPSISKPPGATFGGRCRPIPSKSVLLFGEMVVEG